MNRRTTLNLQLLFAVLALIGLGLTVWALWAFVQQWSFETSTRALQEMLGTGGNHLLNALLASKPGRAVAVILLQQSDQPAVWSVYLPLITTVVSILGFLTTTWLAWRKERRDTRREQLELERLRLEVEALRRQMEAATPAGESPELSISD